MNLPKLTSLLESISDNHNLEAIDDVNRVLVSVRSAMSKFGVTYPELDRIARKKVVEGLAEGDYYYYSFQRPATDITSKGKSIDFEEGRTGVIISDEPFSPSFVRDKNLAPIGDALVRILQLTLPIGSEIETNNNIYRITPEIGSGNKRITKFDMKGNPLGHSSMAGREFRSEVPNFIMGEVF